MILCNIVLELVFNRGNMIFLLFGFQINQNVKFGFLWKKRLYYCTVKEKLPKTLIENVTAKIE